MKIDRYKVERMTLSEFAEKHDLTLEIRERSKKMCATTNITPLYAMFKNTWVSDNGMLIGIHGNGHTEEQAMADYTLQISGRRLKVGEKYIWCPELDGV